MRADSLLVLTLDEGTGAGPTVGESLALAGSLKTNSLLGLFNLLSQNRDTGKLVLKHGPNERVIILNAGEIVADGTPLELVGRSAGKSSIYLAVEGPFDPSPLLAGGAEDLGVRGEHRLFATTDPASFVVSLGEVLRTQAVTLTDLHMHRPSLEDVYLELVDDDEIAEHAAAPQSEPAQALREVAE